MLCSAAAHTNTLQTCARRTAYVHSGPDSPMCREYYVCIHVEHLCAHIWSGNIVYRAPLRSHATTLPNTLCPPWSHPRKSDHNKRGWSGAHINRFQALSSNRIRTKTPRLRSLYAHASRNIRDDQHSCVRVFAQCKPRHSVLQASHSLLCLGGCLPNHPNRRITISSTCLRGRAHASCISRAEISPRSRTNVWHRTYMYISAIRAILVVRWRWRFDAARVPAAAEQNILHTCCEHALNILFQLL